MMRKIRFHEYAERKLKHYKKRRQRKKIEQRLDDLFTAYCLREYGVSFSTYLYATYDKFIDSALAKPSPFLKYLEKDGKYCGAYLSVPTTL